MSDYYTNVDRSPSPQEALDWQRRLDSWPAIIAYKERTYELLEGLNPIIDVGCGPGGDVAALGVERCVGLDLSHTMCSAARAMGATVARSDAERLPVCSEAFAGARADRVVQHVPDPNRALQELIRIIRPGGRVVVSDPDQEALSIHLPGVPDRLIARVKQLRRDVGYRHGHIASTYAERLAVLGLRDVSVDAFVVLLLDPADAFGMESWPRHWMNNGVGGWREDEVEAWEYAMANPAPGFTLSLTYLVASGVKPASTAGRRAVRCETSC